MLRRVRLSLLALSLLAFAAITTPVASASTQSPRGHTPSPSTTGKTIPTPRGKPPAIPFETRIETLGTTQFQSAYGGLGSSSSGSPVIYVVAAHGAAFLSAVRDEATRNAEAKYAVSYVPHSWAQLNALTMKIAGEEKARWRQRGIQLARWGPDAASSKVVIELQSYTAVAERELLSSYGPAWVSVSHKSLKQSVVFMDRYFDRAPFFGGDAIFPNAGNPQVYCTSAFTMLGNNHPSNHYALTAGHCGSRHPWRTNFHSLHPLGNTSRNYFHGFGGSTATDIQTVGPANLWGQVWGNSTTVYFPYTTLHPTATTPITFDGARTGTVFGVSVVIAGPFCRIIGGLDVCNLGEGFSSRHTVCQPGDSGGPVFQRTNSNFIKAVGTITAASSDGRTCLYTLIGAIQSVTNTHLDTNPNG